MHILGTATSTRSTDAAAGKSLSVENTDSEQDIHSSQHEYIA